MHDELIELLLGLEGVRQSPRYHPEGDALYHSLQAFEIARRETDDRAMWAAALAPGGAPAYEHAHRAEEG